jgi:hypothetical protein
MDERRFDDVVRQLATGRSRRTVLKTLAVGAAGGLFAALGRGRVAAQEEDDVTGGEGGAGGDGGTGAEIEVSVGNGGTVNVSAEGGTVTIGDTSAGDIAVEVAVGDTSTEDGDASASIEVGDISSSVDIDVSADAAASASANGGDGNVVDIELTGVSGGDGGAGGDREARVECGPVTCPSGQVCCNESCGICTDPGEACILIACEPCGDVTCPVGQVCCNESCGICTVPGGGCIDLFCE